MGNGIAKTAKSIYDKVKNSRDPGGSRDFNPTRKGDGMTVTKPVNPIVYQGDRVAGFNNTQKTAMGQITGQVSAYDDLKSRAVGIGEGLNSAGLTDRQNTAGDVYATQAGGEVGQYRQQALDGLQASMAGDANFKRAMDIESRESQDRINRNISNSGRYGSGVHGNMITRDIGDTRAKVLSNRHLAQSGLNQAASSKLFSMGGSLANERLRGADRMANLGQQGLQNQFATYNIARQAENDLGGAYKRSLGMGMMEQNQAQQQIAANMQKHKEGLDAPWHDLRQYTNATAGQKETGGIGGALGGAASGAAMGSAFGPWGTLIGGVGGGFLGLME